MGVKQIKSKRGINENSNHLFRSLDNMSVAE